MDEITLLNQLRDNVPERNNEDIARGKATLFAHIESDSPYQPKVTPQLRRRATPWIGAVALGAGVLTVALVSGNIFGILGGTSGADTAAAKVLNSAAVAASDVSDPIVAPGQYLRVKTDAVWQTTGITDNGDPVSYLEKHQDTLYIPADQNDDWVWQRQAGEPYQTFGAESEAFAQSSRQSSPAELLRAPGGAFFDGQAAQSSQDFTALPTDPQQLLDLIYNTTRGAGQSKDGEALVWIADQLRQGTVPATIRAALYQAAALIPGVTITEQQATLNGTTGVAIGRVETATNSRQDIIIDPSNGQFIGEREVYLDATAGLPAGTASSFTTVTTSVVDSAPEGGTPDGKN